MTQSLTVATTSALEATRPLSGDPVATLGALRAQAEGRSAPLPAEMLARHVLGAVPGAPWPVQLAALEALLQQVAATRAAPLRIGRWPAGGGLLGLYRTGDAATSQRTLLEGLDPLRGSCDCQAYLANGLGLCPHLLGLATAIAERADAGARRGLPPATGGPRLAWNPLRPLFGPGDWLDRVTLLAPSRNRGRRIPRALAAAAGRFEPPGGGGGAFCLARTYDDDPHRRLALVHDLLEAARAGDRARARREPPTDPALVALLEREVARLEPRAARGWCRPEVQAALDTLRRPLGQGQFQDVSALLQRGRALYVAPPGYRRVAVAVALAHVLSFSGCVRRAVVVVPGELKRDWLTWWRQLSGIPAALVEGSSRQRAALYAEWHRGALLIDFDQVARDASAIVAVGPELAIVDEGSGPRDWADWRSGAAGAARALVAPYRLLLAAPPLMGRLRRLGELMDWVDELALAPAWRLIPLHGRPHDERRREIAAAFHLETLAARLDPCVVRREIAPAPEPAGDHDRTAPAKRGPAGPTAGPTTAQAGEALPAYRRTRALPPPLPPQALAAGPRSPAGGGAGPGARGPGPACGARVGARVGASGSGSPPGQGSSKAPEANAPRRRKVLPWPGGHAAPPRSPGVPRPGSPVPLDLGALRRGLRVERGPDGRLTIHAAAEVAAPLAALLAQLAAELRGPPPV